MQTSIWQRTKVLRPWLLCWDGDDVWRSVLEVCGVALWQKDMYNGERASSFHCSCLQWIYGHCRSHGHTRGTVPHPTKIEKKVKVAILSSVGCSSCELLAPAPPRCHCRWRAKQRANYPPLLQSRYCALAEATKKGYNTLQEGELLSHQELRMNCRQRNGVDKQLLFRAER